MRGSRGCRGCEAYPQHNVALHFSVATYTCSKHRKGNEDWTNQKTSNMDISSIPLNKGLCYITFDNGCCETEIIGRTQEAFEHKHILHAFSEVNESNAMYLFFTRYLLAGG